MLTGNISGSSFGKTVYPMKNSFATEMQQWETYKWYDNVNL